MNEEAKLLAALRAADFMIGFSPLPGEPDAGDFLRKYKIENKGHSTLADKSISPEQVAGGLSKVHEGEKVIVFIPGREFDILGTRHGRGGGWYDRFLSEVPREWLRIGVLKKDQLSDQPLKRELWDEPMDYLLVKRGSEFEIVEIFVA
jgi:5-formyltetrahydrofolate cyclo-ligase